MDKETFARHYDETYEAVFGYIMRRIGSHPQAEDLTSEVYLKALKYIHTYKERPGKPFIAWLYAIAANTLNDFYKKQDKYRFEELENHPELESDALPEITPDIENGNLDAYQRVQQCLKDFELKDQHIIALRYFEDKSFDEIETITGIKAVTVRSRLHRALKRLRLLVPATNFENI